MGSRPARRTENRTHLEVAITLVSLDLVTYEVTTTRDVSLHGASVLTKQQWTPNQRIDVRSLQGSFNGFARVVHDGASTTIVAACADIFLMVADSPRLDSDGLMTFGFRAVGIGVPGSFATGTARSQYPLCEFFRQLTFQVDCPNAYSRDG